MELAIAGIVIIIIIAGIILSRKKPKTAGVAPDTGPVDRYALMDKDTGLYNKSFFAKKIEEEMSKAVSFKVSLTVALLQLPEGFSSNHDKDAVLRKIATVMTRDVRFSDVVSRYGDENLGILYPMTNRLGADIPTGRLEAKINEILQQSEVPGECVFKLVSYPENPGPLEKLIQELKQ